jgi:hypothetical protein
MIRGPATVALKPCAIISEPSVYDPMIHDHLPILFPSLIWTVQEEIDGPRTSSISGHGTPAASWHPTAAPRRSRPSRHPRAKFPNPIDPKRSTWEDELMEKVITDIWGENCGCPRHPMEPWFPFDYGEQLTAHGLSSRPGCPVYTRHIPVRTPGTLPWPPNCLKVAERRWELTSPARWHQIPPWRFFPDNGGYRWLLCAWSRGNTHYLCIRWGRGNRSPAWSSAQRARWFLLRMSLIRTKGKNGFVRWGPHDRGHLAAPFGHTWQRPVSGAHKQWQRQARSAVLVGEMGRVEVGWVGMRNEAHQTFRVFFFYILIFFLSYFKFKPNLKFKFPLF